MCKSKLPVKLLEVELVLALAAILLLGILFGYSLAKSNLNTIPKTTTMDESFSSDGLR